MGLGEGGEGGRCVSKNEKTSKKRISVEMQVRDARAIGLGSVRQKRANSREIKAV